MNERIAALAREAGFCDNEAKGWAPQIDALVKMVAKDCAEISDSAMSERDCWRVAKTIRERYGIV